MSELIIDEVMYYVCYNNTTKQDVAIQFNRSLSSIKKDFAKFRKYNEENPDGPYYRLYIAEKEKSQQSEHSGKIKGGLNHNSGKSRSLTLKEIINIAKYIVISGCTLDKASEIFKIPKSTLHESIERLKDYDDDNIQKIYQMVRDNYEHNKRGVQYPPTIDLSVFDKRII